MILPSEKLILDSKSKPLTHGELIYKVLNWSKERNLNHQDPKLQIIKLMEELGELSSAILKDDHVNILDGLGDIQVVLIILHQQLGLSLTETLNVAYEEIKDRKGKTVNGTFIKEE